jgi:diguanylate cyclase (GGDEF)-like protein
MVVPAWLLTVGPAAARTGRAIGEVVNCQVTAAESLVEATLVSGNVNGLILVDAGVETDQLEAGLKALRRLNPEASIELVCEPVDEVTCRKALAWGADDYEIVPVDRTGVRRLAGLTSGQGKARAKAAEAARSAETWGAGRAAQAEEMPAISLAAQTQMLGEIMEGGGVKGDFAARATWTMARQFNLGGTLRFVSETEEGAAETAAVGGSGVREYRRVVAFGGQATFGTLIWRPEKEEADAGEVDTLAQGANWLGAMLALAQRYEQMRLMAITDELSGAYNRRYFMKYMEALLVRARENRSRVTLLMFDIDNFKSYNDNFGHAAGDAIIRELIKLLRGCTRPKDLVARIGGDEFAVVYWDNEPPRMPNSEHPKEIVAATERFREAVRQHEWPETCKIKGTVSISGGLATFPRDAETLETLMRRADEALLKAKAAGKNVIVLHGEAGAGQR